MPRVEEWMRNAAEQILHEHVYAGYYEGLEGTAQIIASEYEKAKGSLLEEIRSDPANTIYGMSLSEIARLINQEKAHAPATPATPPYDSFETCNCGIDHNDPPQDHADGCPMAAPTGKWSQYMGEVLPCGHTNAQHEYFLDGEVKLIACQVVKSEAAPVTPAINNINAVSKTIDYLGRNAATTKDARILSLAQELARFALQSFSLQTSESTAAVRLREVCYAIMRTSFQA